MRFTAEAININRCIKFNFVRVPYNPRNPAQGFREIPVWPSEYMVILEDMKPRVWRRVYYRMRHEDSPVETVIKYQDYFRPVDIPNEITKRDRIA